MMKKSLKSLMTVIITLVLVLGLCAALTACEKTTPIKSSATNTPSTTSTTSEKTFTLTELAKFDGKNGNPAYVNIDGIVYDVTNAPMWIKGVHQGHSAGADLSAILLQSPHGKAILSNLTVVGKMK